MIFNEFCKSKNCSHYQEWGFRDPNEEQPYPCVSCDLVGQSYDINTMPKECSYLSEAKPFTIKHNLDIDNKLAFLRDRIEEEFELVQNLKGKADIKSAMLHIDNLIYHMMSRGIKEN